MSSIHLLVDAQAQANIASSEQAALLATKQGAPIKNALADYDLHLQCATTEMT